MRAIISGEIFEICDQCQKDTLSEASFKGELTLNYQGERVSFMGVKFNRPEFTVGFVFCQGCALLLMQQQKGLLLNG